MAFLRQMGPMGGGALCALALLLGGGCRSLDVRLASAASPQAVARAAADFYVSDVGDESCAVAVVVPEGTALACAGGATEHALFRIASLTKLFLHPVLLKLHAEGRLDLDRPVTACTTLGLPPEYASVTLRDLLLNRSGLPREFIDRRDARDVWAALSCALFGTNLYAGFDTREGFVRRAWRPQWRRAVRARREVYSNVGYGLLGMAAEDALGCSLEEMLRAELTGPRRLADTTFAPTPAHRLTRAAAGDLPWLALRGRDVPGHRLGGALAASGGLFSSIADCAAFFASYWPLLDAQLRARCLAALPDEAVFGLLRVHVQPSGRRVLYRAGMIYGGASFVGFDPEARTVVVVLRNVTSWPDRRGFAVLEALRAFSQNGDCAWRGKTVY